MTDKTEAQPEALRLAAWLKEGAWHQMRLGDVEAAGRELRRQHAEIQQLKAEKAHLRDALSDIASGEITRSHCVGPHCAEELGVATADELSSRAAGALNWDDLVAEQSTDVGIPISAQLSARQAAPDGWRLAAQAVIDRWDSPLWRQEVGTNTLINDLRAALSAAPPPPEREPHPPTRHCMCADCAPSFHGATND